MMNKTSLTHFASPGLKELMESLDSLDKDYPRGYNFNPSTDK